MVRKVCHVTSVHKPTDRRIFERECSSLTKHYDVTLIAPNINDYEQNGVHVKMVSLPNSRFKRMRSLNKVYQKMIEVDADVYHFHDPELIPIGLKIKKRGKKIIFDSHEDVPAQILSKTYIPFRKLVSRCYSFYEKWAIKKFDAVVSVTPVIVDRLKQINTNTYMLTNYPIYKEILPPRKWDKTIGFAGEISSTWMIESIIESINFLDVVFNLAGPSSDNYLNQLKRMPGWIKVHYYGRLEPSEVFNMLSYCIAGMAIASGKDPNGDGKKGSIGVTKIYEYMMMGIPVIATDLENWIPIIEGNDCGYCINCDDINQITEKIQFLIDHPDEARRLGENGRKAVKEKYCWQNQEKVLFEMYSKLLGE